MSQVVPPKERARYRLTRASIIWVVWLTVSAITLIPYEIYCVVKGIDGGPLTHVVKWMYGEPKSLRWWLFGCTFFGWSAWLAPHFMFEGWGLNRLIILVGLGLLTGAVGYLITR